MCTRFRCVLAKPAGESPLPPCVSCADAFWRQRAKARSPSLVCHPRGRRLCMKARSLVCLRAPKEKTFCSCIGSRQKKFFPKVDRTGLTGFRGGQARGRVCPCLSYLRNAIRVFLWSWSAAMRESRVTGGRVCLPGVRLGRYGVIWRGRVHEGVACAQQGSDCRESSALGPKPCLEPRRCGAKSRHDFAKGPILVRAGHQAGEARTNIPVPTRFDPSPPAICGRRGLAESSDFPRRKSRKGEILTRCGLTRLTNRAKLARLSRI